MPDPSLHGFKLRRGSVDDMKAVFDLNRRAFAEAWSQASLVSAIESGFDLYICEDAGVLAGYLLSQDILDEVHIMQLAVAENYRRRRVATRLIQYLLREKTGMRKVMLEVRASNHAARRLYAKLGFRESGVRKAYYSADAQGRREDAVLMDLSLPSANEPQISQKDCVRG